MYREITFVCTLIVCCFGGRDNFDSGMSKMQNMIKLHESFKL